jgi:hypothetical protein
MQIRTSLCRGMLLAAILSGMLSGPLIAADAPGVKDGASLYSRWLPVDEKGWTILKPAKDSLIIYVSSSAGDDATGQVYAVNAPVVGADPQKPAGDVKPFKTVDVALKKVRSDSPDWLLLKRGDTWFESLPLRSGRSGTEPMVVSSYGTEGERPLLKTGAAPGVAYRTGDPHHIVVAGLHFYAHTRDPESKDYKGGAGANGFNLYVGKGRSAQGLLLEDCAFRFYTSNVIQGPGLIKDVVIRRSLIADNYCDFHHSQGMYTNNVSLLLEENIFDHNGWLPKRLSIGPKGRRGRATMFNHNTYFSNSRSVIFRRNMFLRPASSGNKWTANGGPASARDLIMENNLYVEGEIGISAGGNKAGPLRFKNVAIKDNVFLHIGRGQPTGRNLGWGIGVSDWDGGVVSGNTLIHRPTDKVTGVHMLTVGASDKNALCRNVTVKENIFCGAPVHFTQNAERLEGIAFTANRLLAPWQPRPLVVSRAGVKGCVFSKNVYGSMAPAERWFSVDRADISLKQWLLLTAERDAKVEAIERKETDLSIESYMTHLELKPSIEAFIEEARKQSRANWRAEFTAAAVNDWVRMGFAPAEP